MTWLIPMFVTAIALLMARDRYRATAPNFNFGAVDMFRFVAAIFYFGTALVLTLVAWIGWLVWVAFS